MTITFIIIILTCIFSIKGFNNKSFFYQSAFYPYSIDKKNEFVRFITSIFIHRDYGHLIFNMISLFFFGRLMEFILIRDYGLSIGSILFVGLYLLGGIASSLFPFFKNKNDVSYIAIGASGAVSAVIFAAVICAPQMEMMILFFPIPIKAYIFGPLYLAFEFFAYKRLKSGIAHDAHIGGAVFGIIYILLLDLNKAKMFIESFMN